MRRGVRVTLPRIHRITAGGRVYRYHRVTRRALPDLPEDHPDFVAAWLAEEQKAVRRPAGPQHGTVAAACDAYLRSPEADRLSPGYRPVILRHVKAIMERGGGAILRDLGPQHIRADLAKLSPAVAASRHKAWRKVCAWWAERGLTDGDVSAGIPKPRAAKTDGHREWTLADVERFRARWPIGTPQRMALEVIQWTGARVSDACRLGPGMVRGGLLIFRQAKTGGECAVPLTRRAAHCDDDRADLIRCITGWPHLVWIVTESGAARSHKAMSSWFSAAATAAGLDDLSAHGLRKFRMNRLAEDGASVLVMQAWVGHATLAEVQHYTMRANRRAAVVGLENPDDPDVNIA